MSTNSATGSHESAAIITALVRADYARELRRARAQARDTLALHCQREFTAAEVDEVLRSGTLPADVKVRS